MATLLRKILRFDVRFVIAYAILAVVGAAVLIGVARFRVQTRRLALAERG